ncbi:MAG: hypothetical protein HUJ74_02265 [Lachnospiraceae bacterium]|nr:hypothetical protein [Lachnospiraceae bacterium]
MAARLLHWKYGFSSEKENFCEECYTWLKKDTLLFVLLTDLDNVTIGLEHRDLLALVEKAKFDMYFFL